jgi:hypothetical protein
MLRPAGFGSASRRLKGEGCRAEVAKATKAKIHQK